MFVLIPLLHCVLLCKVLNHVSKKLLNLHLDGVSVRVTDNQDIPNLSG